ncbi:Hypothetical predicted protein [Marmota monax]|uniref:Uncharacterized protein n=1 Tax=Marmota monax TaxID=9995 RepID=A0A5E4B5B5_MARMO|nr:Hypothetical predicted protein [Marmota monax]
MLPSSGGFCLAPALPSPKPRGREYCPGHWASGVCDQAQSNSLVLVPVPSCFNQGAARSPPTPLARRLLVPSSPPLWQPVASGQRRGLAGGGRGRRREVASDWSGKGMQPRMDAAGRGCHLLPLPAARGPARAPVAAAAAAASAVRGPGLYSDAASAPSAAARAVAMNPSSSAGEEKGATGGSSSSGSGAGSCCLGAEGGADPRGVGAAAAAGAAALEEPAVAGQKEKDEALEEKLRNLTFRKQVSYR